MLLKMLAGQVPLVLGQLLPAIYFCSESCSTKEKERNHIHSHTYCSYTIKNTVLFHLKMLQGVQYSDCPALERTVGPITKTVEL